jgi:aminoglycoside phosphotransferase
MHLTVFDVLSVLPAEWQAKMAEKGLVPVTSGMSGAYVFRILDPQSGDRYLKVGIGTNADQLRREGARTKWLASEGLRVPEVVMQFDGANLFAMTMAALDGQSAVFTSPDNWRPVVGAIAHAFAAMHSLPTNSCPFDESLNVRLARARELIRRGEIDAAQFHTRNAGITPEGLYRRLEAAFRRKKIVS